MITRTRYIPAFAIACWVLTSPCAGQTSPPAVAMWGESKCGLQLGVCFSTNVVKAGGELRLLTWLKNATTNMLFVRDISLSNAPVMTGKAGDTHKLTPQFESTSTPGFQSFNPDLNAGDTRTLPSVTLWVGGDVAPGDYEFGPVTNTFAVSRSSVGLRTGVHDSTRATNDTPTATDDVCTLVSNPLKLRVVRDFHDAVAPPEVITNTPPNSDGRAGWGGGHDGF
jgi:hypothetical protein